ncbi:TetR family transcriptional regulator [Sphingomonas oleivorans]|uniref:TetR family transcriptional regulator n=1 Tax=Sphingomonas oleivorans TaxID=1735121 RepID=A0A2T5G240_9SPHN|nr:TetR/AcrR family transcriptional regulator [Sphingomonas oleivorans]PTQ13208.1 TetR family transcriptional regulator [Sphingomonas oleivorans]
MSTEDGAKAPIRRRERGERRMAQIVEAAAVVLVERGYENANTNLIAAQAGISPGSLYQFFRNKEEIARAVARNYAAIFAEALDQAFLIEIADLPVEAMVDRIVDTLIAVNVAHPALRTVFRGWDAPPGLAEAIRPLQEGIIDRVTMIVARRLPGLAEAERRVIATVTIEIFRGLVPLVLLSDTERRPVFTRELKRALTSYIAAAETDAALHVR